MFQGLNFLATASLRGQFLFLGLRPDLLIFFGIPASCKKFSHLSQPSACFSDFNNQDSEPQINIRTVSLLTFVQKIVRILNSRPEFAT
jgi:hypothetical protein